MRAPGSRWRAVLLWILLAAGPIAAVSVAAQQQPPPRPAQDEFVPIDELPPNEQLPAAPLLIAAYSVAWIMVARLLVLDLAAHGTRRARPGRDRPPRAAAPAACRLTRSGFCHG